MDTEFSPIGVHYHAISPDNSASSPNQMTEERFLHLFEVKIEETLDALIPPNNHSDDDDAIPTGWPDHVKQILLDGDINEEKMNVELQRALKEGHNGLSGLEADKDSTKVSEKQIRNLFKDCYGEGIEDQSINGLPISLQSRPDFAVWNKMMLSCEGKHNDKYDLEYSIRQSARYALAHLYYWLVKHSFLVKTVYGVAVAGTKCKHMDTGKQFAVVLLRVSLPTKIGGKLLLHKYTITEAGCLKDFWTFSRRVCGLAPKDSPLVQFGKGCPALLSMPYKLLFKKPMPSWNMIRNGSAALILCINESSGWDFIKPYLDAPETLIKEWEDEMEGIKYPCFLKSKNYLSTHNPKNSDFYYVSLAKYSSLLIDLKDAYKVPPIHTCCGMYILMADMGIAINESKSFQELDAFHLATKLHSLMKRVLGCQEAYRIVHGDIHIGNLVFDEAKGILHLIDYDEANTNFITRRTPRTQEQHRVYNQELLNDPAAFTKNQLINLFWVIWNSRTDLPSILQSVMQQYDATYQDGNRPNGSTVNGIYDDLSDKLEKYNNKMSDKLEKYKKENWMSVIIGNIMEKTLSLLPFSSRNKEDDVF